MSENDGIVDEFTFCIGGNTIFKVAMDLIVTMVTIYICCCFSRSGFRHFIFSRLCIKVVELGSDGCLIICLFMLQEWFICVQSLFLPVVDDFLLGVMWCVSIMLLTRDGWFANSFPDKFPWRDKIGKCRNSRIIADILLSVVHQNYAVNV